MKKKDLIKGGGYSLNPKPSIFKPIVASSLALALGMSVASADSNQPSFSADGQPVQDNLKTTWTLGSDGLYELTNPDTVQNQASLTIGMYGSGKGKFGASVTKGIFATNGAGIKISRPNGAGLEANLYSGSGSNKTLTFDFSNVGNTYALMLVNDQETDPDKKRGVLQINGQGNESATNTFVGRFGGKGISGNINIRTVAKQTQFNFEKNANLEGLIIIQQGAGDGKTKDKYNSFIFDQGGIKGSVISVTGNSSSNEFSFDSTRSNGDAHISGGILVANATNTGYHTFVFRSKNQSQVVISGELQEKKPAPSSDGSWEATHGLKDGDYAIVVRADEDSSAKNTNTQANFLFETNAKVGKVLAVNYQTTNTRSKANYVIESGNSVTFDSIESKQRGDTTITLEQNTSATVLEGILTDGDGTNTISLGGDATFNIQGGDNNAIKELNFNGTDGGNIFNINGGNTTNIATLNLSGSTGNVLNAKSGKTTITTLTFSGTSKNELTINGGTTNITTFNFNGSGGNSVFNANSGTTNITTLELTSTNNTINANGGSTTIDSSINLNNSKTLNLGIGNGNLALIGNLTAGNGSAGTANINFTGNGTLTSNLTSNANNGAININVENGSDGVISGILTNNNATNDKGINIAFKGSNSSLSIIDPTALAKASGNTTAHTINTLTAVGEGNTLNLSGQKRNSGTLPTRSNFQTLTISDLKNDSKSINFLVYADPEANGGQNTRADRIIIEGSTNSSSSGTENKTHYLGVIGDPHKIIGKDLYKEGGTNNIALATVKDSSGIKLEATTSISGFSLITYDYQTDKTDVNGNTSSGSDYTTYFLDSIRSLGATQASQEASVAALSTNYDLYLANLNSLNKRMGELRNNPHSQGVWARVFNGMQTTKFGLETQSIYTTIQAGYDYAFGSEGANNYVGVALSYANSISKSKTISDLNQATQAQVQRGMKDVTSNAVEVALYNSYVQDGATANTGWSNGLFSDSIVKFSYISTDLSLLDQVNTYNTSNYAITLSQELGYRFLLGQESEWSIDPQAEVAFGYLNQSNLKQTLSEKNYLDSVQNAIMTLRSRVGASFGYDFKRFTQGKDISAKVYVGAYFVNDFISGGDVDLTDGFGAKISLSPLATTSKGVVNLGTDIGIKDQTRIYFDFEKSFGGTIVTDYQINLGVRYSFGESHGYMPKGTKTKVETKAPLRVEETKEKQEQTQTSKNQESAEVKQESKKAQ